MIYLKNEYSDKGNSFSYSSLLLVVEAVAGVVVAAVLLLLAAAAAAAVVVVACGGWCIRWQVGVWRWRWRCLLTTQRSYGRCRVVSECSEILVRDAHVLAVVVAIDCSIEASFGVFVWNFPLCVRVHVRARLMPLQRPHMLVALCNYRTWV